MWGIKQERVRKMCVSEIKKKRQRERQREDEEPAWERQKIRPRRRKE